MYQYEIELLDELQAHIVDRWMIEGLVELDSYDQFQLAAREVAVELLKASKEANRL